MNCSNFINVDNKSLQVSVLQCNLRESTENMHPSLQLEYVVQVNFQGSKWSVTRRHKQLNDLATVLRNAFPNIKLPSHMLIQLDPDNLSHQLYRDVQR